MLKLIIREFIDQAVLFIIAAMISSAAAIALFYNKSSNAAGSPFGLLLFAPPVCLLFGMAQTNLDVKRRALAFLITLPTSRLQIYMAKIISGCIWILILTVPSSLALCQLSWSAMFPARLSFLLTNTLVTLYLIMLIWHGFGMLIGFFHERVWLIFLCFVAIVFYGVFIFICISGASIGFLALICIALYSVGLIHFKQMHT
ncbi:MAG: hypothetical protein A2Y07_06070 [Planctomycetes bacterium GWF2_50_10]|nr:MAG: hypothetical protein A2Y07_06070 [Planctomycetes bacterium GWF2_50_10]